METIKGGGEYIIDQICIRFTTEVESKFYIQMRDLFTQLEGIEEKMVEMSLQRAQKYGYD